MRSRRACRDDRGAVTAELALGIPVLLGVVVGLVWLLAVGAAQVRAVDAARETARAAARGEDRSVALAAGRRVLPEGVVELSEDGEQVTAVASARIDPPGGLFDALAGITVRAEAHALREPDLGSAP